MRPKAEIREPPSSICYLVMLTLSLGLLQPLMASFDMDGDGLGDIWQEVYQAQDLLAEDDSDGDGYSNRWESMIGSDPRDAQSYFGLNEYRFENNNTTLVFDLQVVKGVRYYVESSASLDPEGSWRKEKVILSNGEGRTVLECFLNLDFQRSRYFRVGQEIDEDRDGLTAWEENRLGLDDRDPSSSREDLSDLAWLVNRHLSGEDTPLGEGYVIAGVERSIEEYSRFLNQATYGPTYEEVINLHQSEATYAEWIDQQIMNDPTLMAEAMAAEADLGAAENNLLFRRGWWRASVEAHDQLRQRMAFALSQILVVSWNGSDLVRGSWEASGGYYDILTNGAFGNYADLLEDVTYSIAMGSYLGHLRNQKANPELNTFPDENYAREIMQLFTIGLWELNDDGSRKLDYSGQPIPTYNNFHVRELAKVMTGFSWGGTGSFYSYRDAWDLPMTIWDDTHDRGEKFLVNGGYLPSGQSARTDVRRAIENLVNHPSTAPFISRLLIQRFVTSNPTPGYIQRVARIFADNGKGERGDLGAVIKAILLDPEARGESARNSQTFGKLREPLITFVHLTRAFDAVNSIGSYPLWANDYYDSLGQLPLASPSVFNFYTPDYKPSVELGRDDMVLPEFEILTPQRTVGWPNLLRSGIETGIDPIYRVSFDSVLKHDFDEELALVGEPEELIARLDLVFTYGSLREESKQIIRDMINSNENSLSSEKKLWTAIYLIMTSPEYAVLR